MKLRVVLLTMLVTAVTFAGCADSGTSDAPEETADFDSLDLEVTEETGIIRGVVVDAAIQPVMGALVTIQGTELTTETTETGAFGFDGLEPGEYFLTVEKAGYLPTQQSVPVEAGVVEPPIVKFLLESDPESLPYFEESIFKGFIECSFALVAVRFAACGLVEDYTNNVFLFNTAWSTGVKHIQAELIWDSTQSLGDEMQVSFTDPSGSAQVRVNASEGASPLLLVADGNDIAEHELDTGKNIWLRVFSAALTGTDVVDEDLWNQPWSSTVYPTWNSTAPQDVKDTLNSTFYSTVGVNPIDNEECIEYPALFESCFGAGGVGAVVQQEYEIVQHAFYNYVPPADYRFSASGSPDMPE